MIEDYDNMEKLTVARQMYHALAAAWDDRSVNRDELAMLEIFAGTLGVDAGMHDRLSKQYIRMQAMVFPECVEKYYKESKDDQDAGKRSFTPVQPNDRVINPQVIAREYAMFLQLGDNSYAALTGNKPSAQDRGSDEYQLLLGSLASDFGKHYYLVHKSTSTDIERVNLIAKGFMNGGSPETAGYYHLPNQGAAFDRVECAVVNMLEEKSMTSAKLSEPFGKQPQVITEALVQQFLAHRYGKTYEPEEFFRTRTAVRVSGTQLSGVVQKALLGHEDLFRDAVEMNSRTSSHLDRMRQYKSLSEDSNLNEDTRKLLVDAAELEFENAYLSGLTERQHRHIEPKRPGQFEDLKHLVDVLEVMLEDGEITADESDLYMKISHDALGLSRNITQLILDDDFLHPKNKRIRPVMKIDEKKAQKLVSHPGLR